MQNNFKLCVIGCGGISNECHGPSYKKYEAENPGFILAACCDTDEERAVKYKNKFGFINHYTDYADMLANEKPNAVCVTVSETRTAEVCLRVMEMNYPLFTEKPPGKNAAENKLLADAAKKSGVIHQVGYNRRYIPMLTKLKELMKESAGRDGIQFIKYDFFRSERYDDDFSDTAVHGIDAVRFIADADYEHVRFFYQPLSRYGPNVKNIYMDCVMTSGAHAQLCFCPVSGVVIERAAVTACADTWFANIPIWGYGYDKPGELLHVRGNKTYGRLNGGDLCESEEVYITNGFYDENKNFFDNVKNGARCAYGFDEAMNTSLIKDCITAGEGEYNV